MYSKQRLMLLCGKRNQTKLKYKKMQKKKQNKTKLQNFDPYLAKSGN